MNGELTKVVQIAKLSRDGAIELVIIHEQIDCKYNNNNGKVKTKKSKQEQEQDKSKSNIGEVSNK